MELGRRDALVALGAIGAGASAACAAPSGDGDEATDRETDPIGKPEREVVVAAAEVLYPDEVEGIDGFVERYVDSVNAERPDRAAGIADAIQHLDSYAESWYDAGFADLDPTTRDDALRSMGVDEADPDPSGNERERVRYYVVNEMLYALYVSPTGGRLVGLENPQGHPGGTTSYRRGPES